MDAREVKADQDGNGLLECDERHYLRFLRKVLPGPESTFGSYYCDICRRYFDHLGRPMATVGK